MKLLRLAVLAAVATVPLLETLRSATSWGAPPDAPAGLLTPERCADLALRDVGPVMYSGRIASIAMNPYNANVWYVAAAAGGLWKTSDGGTTFRPMTENLGSFSMGCVALDPKNPDVVWLGSGEQNSQRSVDFGDGLYKSIDGGATWKNVGLTRSEHIARICVDPRNTDVVHVAAPGPLWSSGGDRGVFKTTDGGRSWKLTLFVSENTGVVELVMHPRNPDILLAASFQRRRHTGAAISGGPESAIYKSTDGGETWTKLTNGLPNTPLGRIAMAISPQKPDTVFAEIGSGGFFRSDDVGEAWTRVGNRAGTNMYYGELWADPHKADRLFTMGVNIQVTEDGGKTFQPFRTQGVHVDHHAMAFDSKDPNRILLGNDGGHYETKDGGKTWRHFPTITVSQFYRLCVDNAKPFYNVYAGAQDNNSEGGPQRSLNSVGVRPGDWRRIGGGDGFQPRVDPTDPKVIYATSQNGAITRSLTAGGRGTSIRPGAARGGPGGAAAGASLGLQGQDADDDGGAKVEEVTAGGPAATAGLKANDVITKAGDRPIKTYQELLTIVGAARPGDALRLEVMRDGAPQVVNVTLGQPPPGRGGAGGGRGGAGGGRGGRGGAAGFAAAILGLQGADAGNDQGAKITEVTAGGLAATAGLKANDVVKKVGDAQIKTYQDLLTAVTAAQPGSTLKLGVARGDDAQELSLVYNPQPGRGGRGGGGGGGGGRGGGARWNWDTPYIISPHSHTRLYAAANILYRTDDRGDNWTAISPDLTRNMNSRTIPVMGKVWTEGAVGQNQSTTPISVCNALNESPLKDGLIYVGTNDGLIQITEDGGKTWRKLDKFPGIPNLATVSDVYPSHHEVDTVYASFIYYEYGDFTPYLLKSTNRGHTWTSIASNLPARDFVWSVLEDPVNKNLLFAGTEFGLYFTVDCGQHWVQLKGMPTAAVRDLELQTRECDLACATFGRGVFIFDDITPLRHATPVTLAQEGVVFPLRKTYVYEEKTDIQPSANRSERPNPPFGAIVTYHLRDNLGGKVVLTVTDSEGKKLGQLNGPTTAGFHRVVWNLRPEGGAAADLAKPGTYKVSLAKLSGGALTPLGEPQQFEVIELPK